VATNIQDFPLDKRFKLVDDIRETITAEQAAVPMTSEQKRELDNRLDVYQAIRDAGDPAREVTEGIRARL
jgi:putative addiction module component (TIGR02574 family)